MPVAPLLKLELIKEDNPPPCELYTIFLAHRSYPLKKGIINHVVINDGEDIAKVIGGNVVSKSRRVETFGENDEDEGGEAVVGENDEDEMSEDGGEVEEIQRINNTENDIQEAVTNVMLEYS